MSKNKTLPKAPKNEGVDPLTNGKKYHPAEVDGEAPNRANHIDRSAQVFNSQVNLSGEGSEETSQNDEGYQALTVDELKEEAKSRDLSGYSTLKKNELVELLENDDEAASDSSETTDSSTE